jgi:hypothetical protein
VIAAAALGRFRGHHRFTSVSNRREAVEHELERIEIDAAEGLPVGRWRLRIARLLIGLRLTGDKARRRNAP